MPIKFIKIPVRYKVLEDGNSFYFDCFKRKLKDLRPSDYDSKERLVELFDKKDNRYWLSIETLFGKVIAEAENIFQIHENGYEEEIKIVGVKEVKLKRTYYLYLSFETSLPF